MKRLFSAYICILLVVLVLFELFNCKKTAEKIMQCLMALHGIVLALPSEYRQEK